jgi:uncharacterized radical SAM superfamily Fe-S cluster-containing enzyme
VRGINFQPVAYAGRHPPRHGTRRVTLTGVLKRLVQQTNGMLTMPDFVPLPCNVHRVAVMFAYRKKDEFLPLARMVRLDQLAPHVRNTFNFEMEDIVSRPGCGCMPSLGKLRRFIPLSMLRKSTKEQVAFVTERIFRISVTSFIDAYNFDMTSVKKECVHILTQDLKRIPFSTYNMIHRERYAKH